MEKENEMRNGERGTVELEGRPKKACLME